VAHPVETGTKSYIDAFFPEVGIATFELLERFGYEVIYPRDQTCREQPMANSGFNAECAATEAFFMRNSLPTVPAEPQDDADQALHGVTVATAAYAEAFQARSSALVHASH
jgi:hypothetical protein